MAPLPKKFTFLFVSLALVGAGILQRQVTHALSLPAIETPIVSLPPISLPPIIPSSGSSGGDTSSAIPTSVVTPITQTITTVTGGTDVVPIIPTTGDANTAVSSILTGVDTALNPVTNGNLVSSTLVLTPSTTASPSFEILSTTVSALNNQTAALLAVTSKPVACLIRYGKTLSYSLATALENNYTLFHSFVISPLETGVNYYAETRCHDTAGALVSSAGFLINTLLNTSPPSTETLPRILHITTSTAENSLTISWSTDQKTTTEIEYGPTPLLSLTIPVDATFTTEHRVIIKGLAPNISYYFRIGAHTRTGQAVRSAIYSTKTLLADLSIVVADTIEDSLETTAHLITSPTVPVLSALNHISRIIIHRLSPVRASIAWLLDRADECTIHYGPTSRYGLTTRLSAATGLARVAILSRLKTGVAYHAKIACNDSNGSEPIETPDLLISADLTPNLTPSLSDAEIKARILRTTDATISLQTTSDEPLLGWIEYGPQATAKTSLDINLPAGTHTTLVRNLIPDTVYNLKLNSVLLDGTLGASLNLRAQTGEGTTSTPPDDGEFSSISRFSVVTLATSSIGLQWEATTSTIATRYDIRYSTNTLTTETFVQAPQAESRLLTSIDAPTVGAVTQFTLKRLIPDTSYSLGIRAVGPLGLSSSISIISGHTLPTSTNPSDDSDGDTSRQGGGFTLGATGNGTTNGSYGTSNFPNNERLAPGDSFGNVNSQNSFGQANTSGDNQRARGRFARNNGIGIPSGEMCSDGAMCHMKNILDDIESLPMEQKVMLGVSTAAALAGLGWMGMKTLPLLALGGGAKLAAKEITSAVTTGFIRKK